jgi:hypothetical protein
MPVRNSPDLSVRRQAVPVVINRSTPGGGANGPDNKNAGKPKPASKPAAKGKKAKAGGDSLFDDQRVKIGALVGLIVIAVVVVLFSMGIIGGSEPAPPVTAPAPTISVPANQGAGAANRAPGLGGPGTPVPGAPGDQPGGATPGGAQLPAGSGL